MTEKTPAVPDATEINMRMQAEFMAVLNRERRRVSMKVRDLEEKSGISLSSFYAWSGNVRSPNIANLVALAETLGFEIVMRRRTK